MLFLFYPKCSTCMKAKKFLTDNNLKFTPRNIVLENPSSDELKNIIKKSNLPLKKFFNTSGKVYKELNLKDKLKTLSDDEAIKLLSTNGMLIKRPLLITDSAVLVGYKEDEYKNLLK